MKNTIVKKSAATLLLAVALTGMGSNAYAMKHSSTLTGVVGLSTHSINYTVDEGTATLIGDVDSHVEAALAVAELGKLEGVDRVINLLSVN